SGMMIDGFVVSEAMAMSVFRKLGLLVVTLSSCMIVGCGSQDQGSGAALPTPNGLEQTASLQSAGAPQAPSQSRPAIPGISTSLPVPRERPGAQQPSTQPAQPANPPPIEFRPPILDFGTIRPGQAATGSVQVVNVGPKMILIEASRASCTCTSVTLANTI